MKWVYHASRLVFGGWWLFSGLMHFLWPELQPLGDEAASIAFTRALMASGLFDWIKVIEVVLGVTMLANRAMPLTVIALVPLNVVIVSLGMFLAINSLAQLIFGTDPQRMPRPVPDRSLTFLESGGSSVSRVTAAPTSAGHGCPDTSRTRS